MRNNRWTPVVLALGTLLCPSSGKSNTITINAGESPTYPPTFTTLASGISGPGGPVVVDFTPCCGATNSFMVAAMGAGSPPSAPGIFVSATTDENAAAAGTLTVWITETDLTSPLGTINVTSNLQSAVSGAITSVTLSTYLGTTNGISPPNGTLLDTATFTTSGGQTSTTSVATGPGPYSLQEVYTIVATGAGDTFLNILVNVTATATPEPTSFALVAMALTGIAWLRQRRRTS